MSHMIWDGLSLAGNVDLGSLGKSDGTRKARAMLRKQYEYRGRYAGNQIQGIVNNARAAGLHPLFALGSGMGSSPGFDMPGQAPTGSHADIGIQLKTDLERKNAEAVTKNQELRNQLLQIEIDALKKGSNNIDTGRVVNDLVAEMKQKGSAITRKVDMTPKDATQGVVELKPAEEFTTTPGEKQTLASDMSIRRRLFYTNDKFIYIPNVQELDALLEEPLVSMGIIATMNPNLTFDQIRKILAGGDLRIGPPEKTKGEVFRAPFGLFKIYKDKK